MKYIRGNNRNQLEFYCLEERIGADTEVRLIDLFVDSLNFVELGFVEPKQSAKGGRPAYHPSDLLKLYLYGYLNQIRSSRKLEKETRINIEVMWLLRGLTPDHNTISNFRKDNPEAIRKVFKATVSLAKNFDLIGGKLIAGDGTKLRAQNSKKNNFNAKKIERHLTYIEAKLEEYSTALAEADGDTTTQQELKKKIGIQQQRKQKYQGFQKQMEETHEVQISTSDPESRQLATRNGITEVAYNIQSTVDGKHCLPIHYEVTNENDSRAMGDVLEGAVEELGHNQFVALFDKGYHTGAEFVKADALGVEVLVAVPELPASSMAPHPDYNLNNFTYNEGNETFTCPQGHPMTSNGKWYTRTRDRVGGRKQEPVKVKHYKTKACKACPVYDLCTRAKDKRGRVMERAAHAHLVETNRKRMEEHHELYRKRQTIVEHPFGIIKRQWGFSYIMTKKTIKHASADVGLIFSAYNLKRIFNILPQEELKKYLNGLFSIRCTIQGILRRFAHLKSRDWVFQPFFQTTLNQLRSREYLITFDRLI